MIKCKEKLIQKVIDRRKKNLQKYLNNTIITSGKIGYGTE